MGGFGSTRWGTTVTRMSTEGLLRLDARALARAGGLLPGGSGTVTWGEGATVTTEVGVDTPDVMAVRYGVRIGDGPVVSFREQVPLLRTRCTLGGTRHWFGCPGCGTRCAVLYAFLGRFRCRSCHHLAYASTRVPGSQRVGPERSSARQPTLRSSRGTGR